jgi:hypothetical protein
VITFDVDRETGRRRLTAANFLFDDTGYRVAMKRLRQMRRRDRLGRASRAWTPVGAAPGTDPASRLGVLSCNIIR